MAWQFCAGCRDSGVHPAGNEPSDVKGVLSAAHTPALCCCMALSFLWMLRTMTWAGQGAEAWPTGVSICPACTTCSTGEEAGLS